MESWEAGHLLAKFEGLGSPSGLDMSDVWYNESGAMRRVTSPWWKGLLMSPRCLVVDDF